YSISNVQKDAGMEQIFHWLPAEFEQKYVRNFIANKMLYPTFIAGNAQQVAIEQAIARAAIGMSKKQHMDMNFNTKQIGFLDKLKNTRDDLEKITEAFYFEQAQEAKKFHMHDINIMIGSGGILAHTDNNEQALAMIYDGFRPEGITEIWKDRYFISPHMGKLSAVNEQLASRLLAEDCFDKIGIAIRPIGRKWKENTLIMTIQIEEKSYQIKVGDVLYLPNETGKERNIEIQMEKGFYLKPEFHNFKFDSDLPIFIDAAIQLDFAIENEHLKMFDFQTEKTSLHEDFVTFTQQKKIETGQQFHQVELPYEGSILVQDGQEVTADTVIGENLFDPPKVYVISLFDKTYLHLNPENVAEALRIKEGEEVKHGQRLAEIGRKSFIDEIQFQHYYFDSPVRGRVEKINYDSGTIIMREIQDYTSKPKTVNVAKILNIKPKNMMPYIRKTLNDFVYAGDLIAS
ncbi:MAG: glutamate mutase L, partial [Candidatus Cloacimonadales bacterium]|nr:glutamate mutase L [Candidatus Cloacimonadales bacterium]